MEIDKSERIALINFKCTLRDTNHLSPTDLKPYWYIFCNFYVILDGDNGY